MKTALPYPRVTKKLADKYRPQTLDDIIVSPHTKIQIIRSFLMEPYPSAWLFTGASGLGKTTVSRIMAAELAGHPVQIQKWAGNDVDVHVIREIEKSICCPPLFGGFNVCIIDEADAISAGATVRLLAALDNLTHGVLILTSNNKIEHFDSRLVSRLLKVPFSSHGLAPRAIDWLREVALQEGLHLSDDECEAIIRQTKSNLRESLKVLEGRLLEIGTE